MIDFLQKQINDLTQELEKGRKAKVSEETKKVIVERKRLNKENDLIEKGEIVDTNIVRFQSPKIYQYNTFEKKVHSIETEDFLKAIKSKSNTLKSSFFD